ncbi:MAG: hypothetical protein NXI32_06235 [bacterium]|nr:hypothetical protein [bacterium]
MKTGPRIRTWNFPWIPSLVYLGFPTLCPGVPNHVPWDFQPAAMGFQAQVMRIAVPQGPLAAN